MIFVVRISLICIYWFRVAVEFRYSQMLLLLVEAICSSPFFYSTGASYCFCKSCFKLINIRVKYCLQMKGKMLRLLIKKCVRYLGSKQMKKKKINSTQIISHISNSMRNLIFCRKINENEGKLTFKNKQCLQFGSHKSDTSINDTWQT